LNVPVLHPEICSNGLLSQLSPTVLRTALSLDAIHAVEEARFHHTGQTLQSRRQGIDFPYPIRAFAVNPKLTQVFGQQEWLERGIDEPVSIVGYTFACLCGQAKSNARIDGANILEVCNDIPRKERINFYRNPCLPLFAKTIGKLSVI